MSASRGVRLNWQLATVAPAARRDERIISAGLCTLCHPCRAVASSATLQSSTPPASYRHSGPAGDQVARSTTAEGCAARCARVLVALTTSEFRCASVVRRQSDTLCEREIPVDRRQKNGGSALVDFECASVRTMPPCCASLSSCGGCSAIRSRSHPIGCGTWRSSPHSRQPGSGYRGPSPSTTPRSTGCMPPSGGHDAVARVGRGDRRRGRRGDACDLRHDVVGGHGLALGVVMVTGAVHPELPTPTPRHRASIDSAL